jgi:hypothetical protein
MPTEQEKQARDRMTAGFYPVDGDSEHRSASAQEYTAYYLGEILNQLAKLTANVASLDRTLQAISSKMTNR